MRRRPVAVAGAVLLALSLGVGAGGAPGLGGPGAGDAYLRLEWQAGQTRRGAPTVWGYVHNVYGEPIGNVRLSIVETDAAGRVLSTTVGYVDGVVPPKSFAYFETRVPRAGGQYRVVILHFDLFIDAGGR